MSKTLTEIVVTASENRGLTTGSRIGRDAMEHLQPTSFSDLLELLPGNISKDPDMSSVNSITLRETGAVNALGNKTSMSDDYAITSLGTRFMVDGAPISGDANLQSVPISDSTDPSASRSSVNRGTDMRAISTDNIESVEIIRGIPSAEYGNLTSGLVNIRRIRRATPWTFRFKADGYSKLVSAGKGFRIGNQILNVDAGYLDSKNDPRDNLESYKRLTGSARANLMWHVSDNTLRWNIGTDFTGSFDDAKTDPDLNYNKIDLFKSTYRRYALTSDLTLNLARPKWVSTLGMNASVSYQQDRIERTRQVTPQRAAVAPTSMEEGVHDGKYLLTQYLADFVSDGKPLSAFFKLRADGRKSTGTWLHNYKAGGEWTIDKNYGKGQIYDLTKPLSASWTTRPRDFGDIPALHVLSFYLEDNITALIGASKLELQAGARSSQLPSLDAAYALSGKVYIDPRLNAQYTFAPINAANQPLTFSIAAGWGLTTKMPTVDYLYPQVQYTDLLQLNYYDIHDPLNLSRINLRTYIDDVVNYDLKAARNRKLEFRLGADWGANRLSVTYFEERMTSGFRYSTVYKPYAYRKYDASAIDSESLTEQPSLDNLPYEDTSVLRGTRKVTNGSRIDKRGIEFQLNTARWMPLMTSLTVTGAWFHTRYSNSQMLFDPVTTVVNGSAISDRYVGLYDTADGRINDQFNTNFIFDTQIPRWGLVFTTTVQCMWWLKTRRLVENGTPIQYMDASDGQLHPYTESDASDMLLQHLIQLHNEASFNTQTVPTAIYLNLKATKKIGNLMRISAFVSRIIDYLPDYTSNGLTIRRSSSPYFGMEVSLTL